MNYKTNNVGDGVENEDRLFAFGSAWAGYRTMVGQKNWLNVERTIKASLPEKRHLMNNVHFLSANLLTNPFKNKEWELKVNANYTNNAVERESYSHIKDLEVNQTYFTNILNHFYTNQLRGELIFTKNEKESFFKNAITFTRFWNTDRAFTDMNDKIYGMRNANESVESPTVSFQNALSTIIPWKKK